MHHNIKNLVVMLRVGRNTHELRTAATRFAQADIAAAERNPLRVRSITP